MARQSVGITQSWQEIATGEAVITVVKKGKGKLLFNTSGSDVDALPFSGASTEQQFQQNSREPTYCRASGDGWEVIVEGTI